MFTGELLDWQPLSVATKSLWLKTSTTQTLLQIPAIGISTEQGAAGIFPLNHNSET